jgi:hypothetical protein
MEGQGAKGASLPGTGRGTDRLNDGVEVYTVPQAPTFSDTSTRRFTKVHTFLSYGLVPKVIDQTHTNVKYDYLITPLMEIPVDRPYLYLTPLEYKMLDPNEEVVSLEVNVYQRNVRVAFPTSATTSGIATLNQNKNGIVAYGLNKTGFGFNAEIVPNTSKPMVPDSIKHYSHSFPTTAYGNGKDKGVGMHCMKTPFPLKNYFTASRLGTDEGRSQGWPTIQNYFECYDATMAVNTLVAEYKYEPSCGLLKPPIQPKHYGNPDAEDASLTVPTDPGMITNINLKAGAYTGEILQHKPVSTSTKLCTYHSLIEKSQSIHRGFLQPAQSKVQPSLHVGVLPVPDINLGMVQSELYTDVQAMYDVECIMTTRRKMFLVNERGEGYDEFWENQFYYTDRNKDTSNYQFMTLGNYIRNDPVLVTGAYPDDSYTFDTGADTALPGRTFGRQTKYVNDALRATTDKSGELVKPRGNRV